MALGRRLSNLKSKLKDALHEAETQALARVAPRGPLAAPGEEPPVVARLMVEIRSDGSRTIARGAIEDIATGDRAAIEAQGNSPIELAASLAKTLVAAPFLAQAAVRAMLEARKTGGPKKGSA